MENNRKKVYIETLGCQMNKADTENIFGILESVGYEKTENQKEAELLIINTCSIRAAAEDKAFSYLGIWGKMKRSKPHIKIGICGCMAQQKKEEIFKRAPYIDLIFGTLNIEELPQLLKKLDDEEHKQCSVLKIPYQGEKVQYKATRDNKLTAWVNIQEGCDNFCTYCVVPYVRGRQRSRDFNEIVTTVKDLAKEGYKEVTLLGQTVDAYGCDIEDEKCNLANLLRELNDIEDLKRIRFVTSHPKDITEELIDTVANLDKVCEYFHIPMQSGNTEILNKMKRGYSAEEYYDLTNRIRAKVKDVGITSDFIVAFPGETEEQFQDSVKAIKELIFDQCNTAMYSPRNQTPAATWKDIQHSKEVKKDRINVINKQVKESALKANQKFLNTTQEVLVEGHSEDTDKVILNGRTRNNKLTHFEGPKEKVGELVNIKIVDCTAWSLRGEII